MKRNQFRKIDIGSKITLRNNLKPGKRYGEHIHTDRMFRNGDTLTVMSISYDTFAVTVMEDWNPMKYLYTIEMIQSINSFKYGK